MNTNQMLLLIIALFLIYHMTNVCGDGFSVSSSLDQGNFVLNQTCEQKYLPDCEINYFKDGNNSFGEPQYYQCQKDEHSVCHQKNNNNYIKCTNQCPSCGDISKYTLLDNTKCTKDLVTCKQCLDSKVKFTGINSNTLTDKYSEICPKSGKYTECDKTKSRCIGDLQTILTDTMNSSGNCSIQDLYTKIQNASGELSLNCNGNNSIGGEEEWLDEALSSVGGEYCKPNNAIWTCNRDDIPSYCKNGQCVLTGNTNNKKCSCPEGTVPLNNGKCGKVTCTPGRRVRGVDPRIDKCPIDKKCVFVPAGGIFPGEGSLKCV
jgi:hypothetical protein